MSEKRTFLAGGDDVIGSGTRRGRGIVMAGLTGWTPRNSQLLWSINKLMRDYLLIIPQAATDPVLHHVFGVSNQLQPQQCDQASVIMEMQYKPPIEEILTGQITVDHTDGHGSHCFSYIHPNPEIMFIGVTGFKRDDSGNPLNSFRPINNYENCLKVWDIQWEANINPETNVGEIWLIFET